MKVRNGKAGQKRVFPVADEKRMAAVTKCLDDNFKSDSYVTRFALYAQMKANYKDLPFEVLNYTVDHMEHEGKLVIEDDRIYTEKNYRYEKELASYLPRINEFGLPLDNRRTYTKSDWTLWTASMAGDAASMAPFLAPMVRFLEGTPSRVAFSDWYDTVTGKYEHFIARSVQGGLFMPLLRRW